MRSSSPRACRITDPSWLISKCSSPHGNGDAGWIPASPRLRLHQNCVLRQSFCTETGPSGSRLKIALYIEHGVGNGVGGAELMMANLAGAWSAQHDVDLVHHRPPLTRERLSAFCADDLSRVQIRA